MHRSEVYNFDEFWPLTKNFRDGGLIEIKRCLFGVCQGYPREALDQGGQGKGGENWEIGTDTIYTLYEIDN